MTIPDAQLDAFRYARYDAINRARLAHLETLPLPFKGARVADFGAGIGDHIDFYLDRGASEVTAYEGRRENALAIARRFEGKPVRVQIVDVTALLIPDARFDIGHAYGLLYHLDAPHEFIRIASKMVCTLALETMCSPGYEIAREDVSDSSNGLSGRAVRLPVGDVLATLRENFKYACVPPTQPDHEDFASGQRKVFVASHTPIFL